MHRGLLFTREFLENGIVETDAWVTLGQEEVTRFRAAARSIFSQFPTKGSPNEATTERDLIFRVLEALGWEHILVQQSTSTKRRTDIPDALLFADAEAKARANAERTEAARYRHGLAVIENKAWGIPLDRAAKSGESVPSTQILRYLSLAEVQSDQRIQWAILTNGQIWRLYYQKAKSRAEEFLELDLQQILGLPEQADLFSEEFDPDHWLRVFVLMFRRAAFAPGPEDDRTFHQVALNARQWWQEKVKTDLSQLVFEELFPNIVRSIVAYDSAAANTAIDLAYLEEVKNAALILLYRLLFVLYAEDRYLLPVNEQPYKGYSLRYAVRLPVEEILDQGLRPSETASRFYASAKYLFRAIDEGDEALRLPPYNGRLFEARRAPILERTSLPDGVFADIVNRLSRLDIGLFKRRINYRDLSVRQLGSIYERLLEYDAILENGEIKVRLQPFARKDSGSYYTPDELVRLIIEKTVGPLVDERWQAFVVRVKELRGQKRPKVERLDSLAEVDPAMAMLHLKVCDPAMGSGHFLVALVDYLADQILEALARCSPAVDWADKSAPYVSPLIRRLESLRTHIRDRATSKRWRIPEEQLDDRHLIRRIILKRVVYGVDMNPMAVELAKVSLWLHTFTVGAPLSFLDHHLRCGNSLFGERVHRVMRELSKQFTLLINPLVKQAQNAEAGLRRIAEIADADLAEVKESKETFEEAEQETAALRALLDVRQGLRWLGVHDFETPRLHPSMLALFDGSLGDPRSLLTSNLLRSQADQAQPSIKITRPRGRNREPQPITKDELRLNAARALARARERADEQVFLHWEVAFPDVWTNWESSELHGGFDAIIGNPPWDRLKMQEVEWFASRKLEIAIQQRASDRARMVRELKEKGDPLAAEYERARLASEEAVGVAREIGDYPLLSGGDVNIYSLFVER